MPLTRHRHRAPWLPSVRSKRSTRLCCAVVDAPEAGRRMPIGQFIGYGADAEHLLDLVHQLERVARRAVELVDEGEDGDAAHAADLEELLGLRLHALGGVDQHHRAVGGGQRAVGVLAEVLVARGVEQVDRVPAVARTAARRR